MDLALPVKLSTGFLNSRRTTATLRGARATQRVVLALARGEMTLAQARALFGVTGLMAVAS